jgi:putative endonuclease
MLRSTSTGPASSIGTEGEDAAVAFLKKKGYRILHRNYHTPLGELDIIAKDDKTIVFIEVKTRSNNTFGQPFEAVTNKKQVKLKHLALFFLKHHNINCPARFDVVSILQCGTEYEVSHIINAFS